MATISELFDEAVSDLGNISASVWDPFAIIDAPGLDGHAVFSTMLPRLLAFGAALLVLMSLLRVIHLLSDALTGESRSVMGLGIDVVLAAALLMAYPEWVRFFPNIFTNVGHAVQSASVQDLGAQVSGALSQMGDERVSDFRLWSSQAFELSIMSLIAAMTSTVALVLLWVIAKLQAYLFTFWYLLGPIALSTMVFPPLRHVCRIWFSTYLGVSLMSVTGPILFAILTRSQWLSHAFASGGALDALTCLVFSLLSIITLVSIPILSSRIFSGLETRVFTGAFLAAGSINNSAAAIQNAGSRAKVLYQSLRGTSPKAASPSAGNSASGERG